MRAGSDDFKPNPVGLLSADGCRRGSEGGRRAVVAAGGIWRGSIRATTAQGMGPTAWRREAAADKHVWNNRDDRACDLSGAERGGSVFGKRNWKSDTRPTDLSVG